MALHPATETGLTIDGSTFDFAALSRQLDDSQSQSAEALRDSAKDLLMRQRDEIAARISELKAKNTEGAYDSALSDLEAEMGTIDMQMSGILFMGASQLSQFIASMSAHSGSAAGATAASTAVTSTLAHVSSAVYYMEMNEVEIGKLMAANDAAAAYFHQYEEDSYANLMQAAAANGVDLSGYDPVRDELIAERQAALSKNPPDRVGAARADAQLAAMNAAANQKAGTSPEEQEKAAEEARKAKDRYLTEVGMSARKQAEQQGLSGQAATDFVQNQLNQAEADFDKRVEANLQKSGVSQNDQEAKEAVVKLFSNKEAATERAKKSSFVEEVDTTSISAAMTQSDASAKTLSADILSAMPMATLDAVNIESNDINPQLNLPKISHDGRSEPTLAG